MTSATIKPDSGAGGQYAEGHGYGLVIFASVLLVIGCFNLIYGIAAIANSHVFTAHAHYVLGNLRAWGWIVLLVAVLQLIAGAGIVAGNQLARWFAVAVLALNAIDMMFFIPAYLFRALTIIAMDVVAQWGCAPTAAAGTCKPSSATVQRHGAQSGCGERPVGLGGGYHASDGAILKVQASWLPANRGSCPAWGATVG